MTSKFAREKHLVETLLKRLGAAASEFLDPNNASGVETRVDVVVVIAQARIGIQVTELDMGSIAGKARADEKNLLPPPAAAFTAPGRKTITSNSTSQLRGVSRERRFTPLTPGSIKCGF
ncbi:hypothetical protein [Bradyrhizobium sp.]|jgi:hypothetical protein|uniref:hypothetical protein n=1 Tax=Bradyrhizobium sp. TaxID=376 RepID=UPI003C1A6EE1